MKFFCNRQIFNNISISPSTPKPKAVCTLHDTKTLILRIINEFYYLFHANYFNHLMAFVLCVFENKKEKWVEELTKQ